jgi:hypothetical protein
VTLRVFVLAVPGLHQISEGAFGSINPAKGFRLLQAEASQRLAGDIASACKNLQKGRTTCP